MPISIIVWIDVSDRHAVLTETAPGIAVADILAMTEAELVVSPEVREMIL